MSQNTTKIQGTIFETDTTSKRDERLSREVGPGLCTLLRRMIRLTEMLPAEHNQVLVATRDLSEWLEDQFNATEENTLLLQLTEENYFINGQLLRMDSRQFARLAVLKDQLLRLQINQLTIHKGVGAGEWQAFCRALIGVRSGALPSMEFFNQPNLSLSFMDQEMVRDEQLHDEYRKIVQIYAGLLVKTSSYFHRLKRTSNPTTRHLKRMLQRMCDELDDNSDVFIGLINLKMFPSQDFIHAANTAVFSMIMAYSVGIDRQDVVRCGMTAITQDVHQIRHSINEDFHIEVGEDSHFQTNLTTVVTLSEMGAQDLLSALRLVTSYERGFPFNKPLPHHWYEQKLRPHLLSRIIEIASHFDIWLYGLEGQEAKEPDLAMQTLMAQMGSHYDPILSKLFINLMGIYPVGSVVELSTGQQAFVLKSPMLKTESHLSNAHRPVVKLLDEGAQIMDLGESAHQGIKIVRIVPLQEQTQRSNAFLLF